MITRKDYMANSEPYVSGVVSKNHRAYFAQFVTERCKDMVRNRIGLDRLKASTDAYMNDISLSEWDRLCGGSGNAHRGDSKLHSVPGWAPVALLREAGESLTLGTMVCIAKEAARQLVD